MSDVIKFFTTTSQYDSHAEVFSDSNHRPRALSYNFSNMMPRRNIFLMARAFLAISAMTHKKLQKLCYYAKAWHLAMYDTNIISEDFQAWIHGAVQPELYHHYKQYRYDEIPMETNISDIPEYFLGFAREIYASYGHLTGNELEEVNHTETPWLNARAGLNPWESCDRVISEEDMKLFYRNMMK